MASLGTGVSAAGLPAGSDTSVAGGNGGNNSGLGGNGSRESSEFEFVGNRQITPNPLFFHANQQSLLFQTVQETEGKVINSVMVDPVPPGSVSDPLKFLRNPDPA